MDLHAQRLVIRQARVAVAVVAAGIRRDRPLIQYRYTVTDHDPDGGIANRLVRIGSRYRGANRARDREAAHRRFIEEGVAARALCRRDVDQVLRLHERMGASNCTEDRDVGRSCGCTDHPPIVGGGADLREDLTLREREGCVPRSVGVLIPQPATIGVGQHDRNIRQSGACLFMPRRG